MYYMYNYLGEFIGQVKYGQDCIVCKDSMLSYVKTVC